MTKEQLRRAESDHRSALPSNQFLLKINRALMDNRKEMDGLDAMSAHKDFDALDDVSQQLIRAQITAMKTVEHVLILRLKHAQRAL